MPTPPPRIERERRWIPAYCVACQADHGVTVGALLAIVEASQNGDLITTGGTTLCIGSNLNLYSRIGNYRVDFAAHYQG